ncbi:amino acid ABC transporter substrate-binding protein [Nocardioides marmoribigeumensis]|uniref:Cystine transport system substrate-binding protein n=1 Tax=Nocardioides marmoribigeumensis TaxID=433649 RepID=A0ABU2C1Q7_9ACTN|nr:amino acid ABC transporter substrate-binding protein [Nocardioides marmoribigeumensis]MDR7364612.1 cystine transport system substrate-binding protein [Nocardioides marmoribigeumensis]
MTSHTRLLTRRVLAATLAAATLSLAACGGGPDKAGSTGVEDQKSGTSLASIEKDGVITVGTEGTYRPFTFHEGGSGPLTGYDVEVMRAVADELGVEVKFEETQWDAIFAGLNAGRFDAIANQVSITPERTKDYAFSTPYTVSPGVVVVRKGDTSISSFEDLRGKTTAQSLTSNWYDLAKQNGAEIQNVEGWAQAVALLEQGRVDATVNDSLTFLDWQKTEGKDTLQIAARTQDEARNAIAFRQGSDDLVTAVDRALEKLRKDGTLTRISEKYFGEDVSG